MDNPGTMRYEMTLRNVNPYAQKSYFGIPRIVVRNPVKRIFLLSFPKAFVVVADKTAFDDELIFTQLYFGQHFHAHASGAIST